ncbi:hypothetical protein L0F63_000015 [Massospora cicadina]|nr:hypothetical protein L0F63_000015 [Massospora cicadina]
MPQISLDPPPAAPVWGSTFAPAGFINFRPFKGCFDIYFQTEEDAEVAALTPIIYENTPPIVVFTIPSACLSSGGLTP